MDKYSSRRKSTRTARHDERINSQCLSVCIGSMLRLESLLCTYKHHANTFVKLCARPRSAHAVAPCICSDLQLRWRFRLAWRWLTELVPLTYSYTHIHLKHETNITRKFVFAIFSQIHLSSLPPTNESTLRRDRCCMRDNKFFQPEGRNIQKILLSYVII